jgi:alkylated DNA nucleotide flippase Atl1
MPPTRQPAKTPTDFESRVYEAVAKIPRGHVSTYSAIASEIGSG